LKGKMLVKNLLLPFGVLVLSGCAIPQPIPPDIQKEIQQIPAEDLQRYPLVEQQRCTRVRTHFIPAETLKCKYRIRREKAERKLMEERNQQ